MPKSVKKTLLERRSIRRYERDAVSDNDMRFIHDAIRNTPTSYNGQQYTVIDIDDPETKERLYEITGQKQIKTCNRFLLFCADYNKITLAGRAKGIDDIPFTGTVDGLIVGVVDASLAMMSALTAAESLGLGTCCVGYARTADPSRIAALLSLPRGVFAVCGLTIGIPRELPDLKPKQPEALLIHRNVYRRDDMLRELMEYDREVTLYNENREGTKSTNDWATHIIGYYREGEKYNLGDALRRQGFLRACAEPVLGAGADSQEDGHD